jgi:hypothetical protein
VAEQIGKGLGTYESGVAKLAKGTMSLVEHVVPGVVEKLAALGPVGRLSIVSKGFLGVGIAAAATAAAYQLGTKEAAAEPDRQSADAKLTLSGNAPETQTNTPQKQTDIPQTQDIAESKMQEILRFRDKVKVDSSNQAVVLV